MHNTCAELRDKYGISYDTIEYLVRVREAYARATPHHRGHALAAAVAELSAHLGISEDAVRAVVGVDGDAVPPNQPPGGSLVPVPVAAPVCAGTISVHRMIG
jgi:hypothetical protein